MMKIRIVILLLILFLINNSYVYVYAYESEVLDYKNISVKKTYSEIPFSPLDFFSFNVEKYNTKNDIKKIIKVLDEAFKVNDSWNKNIFRQTQYYVVKAKLLEKINDVSAIEFHLKYLYICGRIKKLYEQKAIPMILPIFLNYVEKSLSSINIIKRSGSITLEQILNREELKKDKEINRELTKEELEHIIQYYDAKNKGIF